MNDSRHASLLRFRDSASHCQPSSPKAGICRLPSALPILEDHEADQADHGGVDQRIQGIQAEEPLNGINAGRQDNRQHRAPGIPPPHRNLSRVHGRRGVERSTGPRLPRCPGQGVRAGPTQGLTIRFAPTGVEPGGHALGGSRPHERRGTLAARGQQQSGSSDLVRILEGLRQPLPFLPRRDHWVISLIQAPN